MNACCRLRWSGGGEESGTLEEGRRGQPQAGELSLFLCPTRLSQQCPLLKAAGVGTARTVDKSPRVVSWVILFFCKSWCRLRVLEPSQMNGSVRQEKDRHPEGRGRRVRSAVCFPEGAEGVYLSYPGSQARGW